MPYIAPSRRCVLKEQTVRNVVPGNVGELTYVLSQIVDNYLVDKGFCYERLAAVTGSLETLKLEIYRVLGGPYEQAKLEDAGTVWSAS